MRNRFSNQFLSLDVLLLGGSLLLVTLGLIILYSLGVQAKFVSNQLDTTRQFIYAIIGITLMIVAAKNDYKILSNYTTFLYIIMIVTLILVELFGASRFGATRWIAIGPFQFQPSELAKLILVIVLAKFYSTRPSQAFSFQFFSKSVLLAALPIILVLIQPDLGTAIVLASIWLIMTLATNIPKRYILGMLLIFLISMPIIYPNLAPYQRQRINTFLDPTADPARTGYNVNQAIIAVGSGGIFGQGLGSGSQSQGNFLPSSHTDFVFAVLAEKLGLVGAVVCIILFILVISRIVIDGTKSRERFGGLLCIGIATMFLVHMFINIGMNLGIMPVTGIPLPFISAGGTSLMVSLISIGIVQSVYLRRANHKLKETEIV